MVLGKLFYKQVAILLEDQCLQRDETSPYWPLRKTAAEAKARATPLDSEHNSDTAGSLATLEIEFTGVGLCAQ